MNLNRLRRKLPYYSVCIALMVYATILLLNHDAIGACFINFVVILGLIVLNVMDYIKNP